MILTDEQISEFQTLYRKNFGVEISRNEALEKGLRLIRLLEVVLKKNAKKRSTPTTH